MDVYLSCTHYNHKLGDLRTLCQETLSSRLRLIMRRDLYLFVLTWCLITWFIASCTHYNHTILRLHENVTNLSWVSWVYTVPYIRYLAITVLSLLFSVCHLIVTWIATDVLKFKSLAFTNSKKLGRSLLFPSLLAFILLHRGNLRPGVFD